MLGSAGTPRSRLPTVRREAPRNTDGAKGEGGEIGNVGRGHKKGMKGRGRKSVGLRLGLVRSPACFLTLSEKRGREEAEEGAQGTQPPWSAGGERS
ncbi:hypothetical protein MRX96_002787 [Rhipicephalus microplus]